MLEAQPGAAHLGAVFSGLPWGQAGACWLCLPALPHSQVCSSATVDLTSAQVLSACGGSWLSPPGLFLSPGSLKWLELAQQLCGAGIGQLVQPPLVRPLPVLLQIRFLTQLLADVCGKAVSGRWLNCVGPCYSCGGHT